MMENIEKFEINGQSFVFTEKDTTDRQKSRIYFEDGMMNAVFVALPIVFDNDLHMGVFNNHLGKIYISFYISNIWFNTDKAERIIKYPEEKNGLHFFTITGFDKTDDFYGVIKIKNNLFSMIGEMRDNNTGSAVPISIIKNFNEGFVDSIRCEFTNSNYLSVDPKFVKNAIFSIKIPSDIKNLKYLEKLRITNFKEKNIPDVFGCFPNLKELALYDLPDVENLPKSLFELRNLEDLYLGKVGMPFLSSEIVGLSKLKNLSIFSIKMDAVPDELFLLPELEFVLLNYMDLKSLPKTLAQAKKLKKLDLKGNQFEELPSLLSKLEVVIENKFKKLFRDNSYPFNKSQLINNDLFKATLDKEQLEDFGKLLDKYDLGEFEEQILLVAQNSISFYSTQLDDYVVKGNTRFGGRPDLPKGIAYPTTDGKLWVFLAQLNLEDIAEYQDYLPKSGRLYFFAEDLEFVENVKVIYDTSVELKTYNYPKDLVFNDSDQDEPFVGFKARLEQNYALPHLFNVSEVLGMNEKETHVFEENNYDNYLYFLEALECIDSKSGPHCINNFVFTQNESVENQAASKKGGDANEWMTLLSLASDNQTGFCFWDAGTLSFVIHKKDLAAMDFSNVMAFIETS